MRVLLRLLLVCRPPFNPSAPRIYITDRKLLELTALLFQNTCDDEIQE